MSLVRFDTPKITIDSDELEYITSMSFSLDDNEIDTSVLSNVFDSLMLGSKKLSIDVEMLYDTADTVGGTVETAGLATADASRKLTSVKVYFDSTNYIYADTVTDTNACVYVKNWKPQPIGRNDVVKVSFTLSFSGAFSVGP